MISGIVIALLISLLFSIIRYSSKPSFTLLSVYLVYSYRTSSKVFFLAHHECISNITQILSQLHDLGLPMSLSHHLISLPLLHPRPQSPTQLESQSSQQPWLKVSELRSDETSEQQELPSYISSFTTVSSPLLDESQISISSSPEEQQEQQEKEKELGQGYQQEYEYEHEQEQEQEQTKEQEQEEAGLKRACLLYNTKLMGRALTLWRKVYKWRIGERRLFRLQEDLLLTQSFTLWMDACKDWRVKATAAENSRRSHSGWRA